MDNKFKYFTSMLNRKVLKSICGEHKLIIPETPVTESFSPIESTYEFVLTESYLDEWDSLYKSKGSGAIVPYTYYWPGTIKYSMEEMLCGLGMKMKYALHLGQETRLFQKYAVGTHYILKNRLVDICHLNHNRIIIITEALVDDVMGNPVIKSKDYTFFPEIDQDAIERLTTSTFWNNHSLELLKNGLKRKKPLFEDREKAEKTATYYCPKNLWWVFGSVSGGTTLTHGFRLPSKLIRKEEPFMQGMCSGNIVLKFLSQHLGEDLAEFNVFFNNKLFFPQTVELRCDDEHFELYDKDNNMVTFGSRKVRAYKEERADEKIDTAVTINNPNIIELGI